jgi:hypothetical protein
MEQGAGERGAKTPIIAWTRAAAVRQQRTGRPRARIGPVGALLVLATFFYFFL